MRSIYKPLALLADVLLATIDRKTPQVPEEEKSK